MWIISKLIKTKKLKCEISIQIVRQYSAEVSGGKVQICVYSIDTNSGELV